jgi:hypothetical protein
MTPTTTEITVGLTFFHFALLGAAMEMVILGAKTVRRSRSWITGALAGLAALALVAACGRQAQPASTPAKGERTQASNVGPPLPLPIEQPKTDRGEWSVSADCIDDACVAIIERKGVSANDLGAAAEPLGSR